MWPPKKESVISAILSHLTCYGMVQLPKIFPGTSDIKPKVPRDELLADVAACQGPKIEGTKVSGLVVGGGDGGCKGHIA